jgi:hypothetical protein
MSNLNIDDLLGNIDDLLGPAPTPAVQPPPKPRKKRNGAKAKAAVDDLLGRRKYRPFSKPKNPRSDGIFVLREEKGKNLGRTCLICKVELKHRRGRPPIICRKKTCFRAYRNAYRHDYDEVRA